MAGLIDTIYTFRFLKLLSTKWENTDAYKLGIIDENGKPLKKVKEFTTTEEKKAYTPFVRLVYKLKRLMGTIPGGKSAVARYGAAVLLIKEHSDEVERMGINLKDLEEGLKKYIGDIEVLEEKFVNIPSKKIIPFGNSIFTYSSKVTKDLDNIIKHAVGLGLEVKTGRKGLDIKGSKESHNKLIDILNSSKISGMISEEVTNSVGGIDGKEQPLGKKGEIKKRKKKKEDEVVNKTGEEDKNEEVKYKYQMIGDVLVRVDEIKRRMKKRVVGNKRQKKREYVPTKRRTRTGKRKLRGGAKAKWKRSHRKAYRKAHTGSAAHKRKRSAKKSRKYNRRK